MEGKEVIKFLGQNLYLSKEDRKDPLILLFLALLEKEEKEHQNGYNFFVDLRDKYMLRTDVELENQLKEILFIGNKISKK